MDYLIGDLQGCCDPLDHLLATIDFSPSRDRIHLLGDLVNRGPQSLAVLQRLTGLGDAAQCLLGNHDLHLLAVAHGVRKPGKGDTLDAILADPRPRRPARLAAPPPHGRAGLRLAAGARRRRPAMERRRRRSRTPARSRRCCARPTSREFLPTMYGNEPRRWDPDAARPRPLALHRQHAHAHAPVQRRRRARTEEGRPRRSPAPACCPWFEHPNRLTRDTPIAFGHWSQLGLVDSPLLLSTDTGCVWGGALTAVRVDGGRREVIQVACPQARKPG